jgi:hypothetical protein
VRSLDHAQRRREAPALDQLHVDAVEVAGKPLDIFLERLRTQLYKNGKGRITLVQNRAAYRDRQAGELEIDTEPHGGQPGPKGIQPDFQLDGVVSELPNRGTSYYYMSFSVNNLRDRTVAWTDAYEVRVAR